MQSREENGGGRAAGTIPRLWRQGWKEGRSPKWGEEDERTRIEARQQREKKRKEADPRY